MRFTVSIYAVELRPKICYRATARYPIQTAACVSPGAPSRCRGPRFGRAQIRQESAESGNATVAGQNSQALVTSFQLLIHQVFQYHCYWQVLNKSACAVSVLTNLGPDVPCVTNAMSEQIKAGLRLRAHASYAFSRIWESGNFGTPHRHSNTESPAALLTLGKHLVSSVIYSRFLWYQRCYALHKNRNVFIQWTV